MGISSALYSGVSGLNTNSQAMSVIGNNLANTNTVGFKGSRTVFADLLSSTINGSGGSSQVGRGVGMSKVDQIFSQGTFESTESNLDVAIEGEGFFILKEPGNETPFYSRAGSFRFNDEGYLINPEGYRVQGKQFDVNGELQPGDATDIQVIGSGLIQGAATTELTLTTNLDSSEPIITTAFDLTNPDTYNYSSSVQIFDSLGNPHLLTTYFIKTADNTWAVNWSAENEATPPVVLTGALPNLTFTSDGILTGAAAIPPVATVATIPAIDWANGSNATGTIQITFDTTQFNSESVVISQDQNGFGAGNLTGVAIDPDGIVVASYSNGQQTKIAQLVLGKFVNPGGLSLVGSNLYNETTSSGPARTGLPGPELGKVFTNSLEQSNVDMGAEFVRMITVQRGFQANSKIITTVDELLGELINLKR
jgi:flagellar hook protein FlgE